MKIADGFMLRNILESWVVVPVGKSSVDSSYMLSLSESSALLWKKLETGAEEGELVELLTSKYDIDRETASADVKKLLAELESEKLLVK